MDENKCKNEKLIDFTKKKETIPYDEKVYQCQCSSSTESPFCIVGEKEPLSTPFWFCIILVVNGVYLIILYANKYPHV